ncbi:ketohexokinase-like isoform X2 [Uloborus diversus]|nr:ketohexokinase-like isoform X2 [Uloborus diversus]
MSRDMIGQFLKKDFEENNIIIRNFLYREEESPISYIWLNTENLSNTIVGPYKYLPEVTYEDFWMVDLKEYTWIHYESGPEFKEMKRNLEVINRWNENAKNNYVTVSIAIVDPSPAQAELIGLADVIFISKEFAETWGIPNSTAAVDKFRRLLRLHAVLICFWSGTASAREYAGPLYYSDCRNTGGHVSTLDADETFTVVTILCLMKGNDMETAIKMGCNAAGTRCSKHDVKGLSKLYPIQLVIDGKVMNADEEVLKEASKTVKEILNAVEEVFNDEKKEILNTVEDVLNSVEGIFNAEVEVLNADKEVLNAQEEGLKIIKEVSYADEEDLNADKDDMNADKNDLNADENNA